MPGSSMAPTWSAGWKKIEADRPIFTNVLDTITQRCQNPARFQHLPRPAMFRLLLLHGPNLNLLGRREPAVYGTTDLDTVNRRCTACAQAGGHQVDALQSNAEHVLIERVHAAGTDGTDFIVINPGGFTHTSVALRDALAAVAVPFIEVHLSNIAAREPFRRHSYFSDLAQGVISGLGPVGYELAVQAALDWLARRADRSA